MMQRRSAVHTRSFDSRVAWLTAGAVFGAVVTMYWPHEQAQANAVDRSSKVALATCRTNLGASDAIFVLDFVTGRLVGAAYNTQTSSFNQTYARNLAQDFNVQQNAQYAIVPGDIEVAQRGGATPASGGIYVAELNSGKVILYGFAYNSTGGPIPLQPLIPLDGFSYRQVQ